MVTSTVTSTTFTAIIIMPTTKANKVPRSGGDSNWINELFPRDEVAPAVDGAPPGSDAAAIQPNNNNDNLFVCPKCPSDGKCCPSSALTITTTTYKTLVKTTTTVKVIKPKTKVVRKTSTVTAKSNIWGPWRCLELTAGRHLPIRADNATNAPVCVVKTGAASSRCDGTVKGGMLAGCLSFTSKAQCEATAITLARQGLGNTARTTSNSLYVCPKRYSLTSKANVTQGVHEGDCGMARHLLRFYDLLAPFAYAFLGPKYDPKIHPESMFRAPRSGKKVKREEGEGAEEDVSPKIAHIRRQAQEAHQSKAHQQQHSKRASNQNTIGMLLRVVNQTPNKTYFNMHGDGYPAQVTLGFNECADIYGPVFSTSNWFYISAANSPTDPNTNYIGLNWQPSLVKNGWAELVAGSYKTCCSGGQRNSQFFYAFNEYQKDQPTMASMVKWAQQAPDYRGVGNICMHDNGTVILGHPCQGSGDNPEFSNVPFVVLLTGANKTGMPYPPFASPTRIYSRTNCINLSPPRPAGYPTDKILARRQSGGKASRSIIGPNYQKLLPMAPYIKINATWFATNPPTRYTGTAKDMVYSLFLGGGINGAILGEYFREATADAIELLSESMGEVVDYLAETLESIFDAFDALGDVSGAFANLVDNDLWDMVDDTAATFDLQVTADLNLAIDATAVESCEVLEVSSTELMAGSVGVDTGCFTRRVARDGAEDATADEVEDEVIDTSMDCLI